MNQILSTTMPRNVENKYVEKEVKSKQTKQVDIKSLLKVFSLILILYGIFTIGSGSYSFYKNQKEQTRINNIPQITISSSSENSLALQVTSQINLAEVKYRWNDGKETVVNGNQEKFIQENITIPGGKNTLYVTAKNVDGQEVSYNNVYELASKIKITTSGNKVKITTESDKIIKYMTYRWDEEDEVTININSKKVDQEIDAKSGEHELTVITVDKDNNTDTKAIKVNGIFKPEVIVDVDETNSYFVIKASDDKEIKTIEFKLGRDEGKTYKVTVNKKEIVFPLIEQLKLVQGENYIVVTAYDSDNLSTTTELRQTKQ